MCIRDSSKAVIFGKLSELRGLTIVELMHRDLEGATVRQLAHVRSNLGEVLAPACEALIGVADRLDADLEKNVPSLQGLPK